MYHLLSTDPQKGASELEKLDRNWSGQARPEDRYALGVALKELQDANLLRGSAQTWVLLVLGWIRIERGESSQLAGIANEALRLARLFEDGRIPKLHVRDLQQRRLGRRGSSRSGEYRVCRRFYVCQIGDG